MLLERISSPLNERFSNAVFLAVVGSVFVIPISISAQGVLISLVGVFMILTPSYRQRLFSIFKEPWCQTALLFFLLVLLACIWSPASHYEKMAVVKKYSKLLSFPFFVVAFRDEKSRRGGQIAFLSAMVLTCCLSILKAKSILFFRGPDAGAVFHNHIITSFMMAFAAYLSGFLWLREKQKWWAILFLLFSYQLIFINTSRTGYICYLLLIGLLWVQHLSRSKALVLGVFAIVLFTVGYYQSHPMAVAIKEGISNFKEYKRGEKNTSVGFRLQFHQFSKHLMLKRPLIGNGTGSYTYFFRKDDPLPEWQSLTLDSKKIVEPHSQYWLIAAELGILGLLGWLLFYGSLCLASLKLPTMKPVATALLLSFAMASLSDSFFFYSTTGYFFLIIMAMCLGEALPISSSFKPLKLWVDRGRNLLFTR